MIRPNFEMPNMIWQSSDSIRNLRLPLCPLLFRIIWVYVRKCQPSFLITSGILLSVHLSSFALLCKMKFNFIGILCVHCHLIKADFILFSFFFIDEQRMLLLWEQYLRFHRNLWPTDLFQLFSTRIWMHPNEWHWSFLFSIVLIYHFPFVWCAVEFRALLPALVFLLANEVFWNLCTNHVK